MSELKLKPLTVPNFVVGVGQASSKGKEWTKYPSYPLSEVDSETLETMCDDFKLAVLAKARE